MIVDNKSNKTNDFDKFYPPDGDDNGENKLKSLKVKSELRPLMRKVVDILDENGMATRKQCSNYRYQIKMGSKNNIMSLAEELRIKYGDKLEKLLRNKSQPSTQPKPKPDNSGLKFKAQENEATDSTSNDDRIGNLENKVDTIADMIAKGLIEGTTPEEVKTGDSEELRHWQFDTIKLMLEENKQVLLVGEAGNGKTYLGKQLATALDCKNFHSLSLTSGMSEAHLTGRMNIMGEFLAPEVLNIVENGGLLLLDEFDNGDSDVLTGLNSLLANGFISAPLRTGNELAIRHKDCYIVCSANTWANANSSSVYVRKQLDGATLDRFVCSKVELGVDRRITMRIMGLPDNKCEIQDYPKLEMLSALERQNVDLHVEKLVEVFDTIKKYTLKSNMQIRQMCSNRAYEQGARLVRRGITPMQVLKIYLQNWTDEELKRVGVERDRANEFYGVISYGVNEKKFFEGAQPSPEEDE
jgi:MoxR-like ATPase